MSNKPSWDATTQNELINPRGSYYRTPGVHYVWDTPLDDVKQIFTNIVNDVSNTPLDNRLPANKVLAGEIKEEYNVSPPPELNEYFSSISQYYNSCFRNDGLKEGYIGHTISNLGINKKLPLKLNHLWVNFQKKYEYNPPHHHSGVLSFVYYHQIPYYIEDEFKRTDKDILDKNDGTFHFLFPNGHGIGNWRLCIDKRWEGKLLVFPSSLFHTVYPFYTSDGYRITIAGNLTL